MENQKSNNKKRYWIRDVIIKPRTPKWERRALEKNEAEEYLLLCRDGVCHPAVRKIKKTKHFLKWAIKLIVPDFLIGHPNLRDNLKTLLRDPRFHPLRMAINGWIIFALTISLGGFYILNQSFKTFASLTTTFVDNSSGTFAGTHSDTQWDASNSWVELSAAGQTALTGNYTSEVKDSGSGSAASTTWSTLAWVPSQPFYKELPGSAVTESGYATGTVNMTGNVLLMHLNETGANAEENGTITDSSGSSNTGTLKTGSDGLNKSTTTAVLNTALGFDGSNDYVSIADSASLDITTAITLEAWVNLTKVDANYKMVISKWYDGVQRTYELGISNTNNPFIITAISGGTGTLTASPAVISTNTWYYIVGTYESGSMKIYVNGYLMNTATSQTGNIGTNSANLFVGAEVGQSQAATNYFPGRIDEVAIYNRVLGLTEIQNRYKRGAEKLRFQVRDCDDAACSGESWMGPAASTTAYYSELNNTSTSATPSISLSGLGNNRYFQYKAYFDTATSTASADMGSATIGYTVNVVPATPTNSSPANASTTVALNPTLTGSAYSDPTSDTQTNARWEIDDAVAFTSPDWTRTAGAAEISTVINSTNGTFANSLSGKTKLAHNTTYYWRVAYKDGELWTASSTATSFTTNVITTPTNSSPVDGATVINLTPTLVTSAFSDLEAGHTHSYSQWEIDNNSDFSSVTYDSGMRAAAVSFAVPTAAGLSNNTTYYWRVSYVDSDGQRSASSTGTYFDVNVSTAAVMVKPVFGNTTVDQGDTVKMDVQVVNYSTNAPINDAEVALNIYSPAGVNLVNQGTMDYLTGSNGVYRYSYTVPSTSGSYLYDVIATSSAKLGYGAANFEVRTLQSNITSISSTVTTNLDTTVSSRGSQSSLTTVGTQVENASSTLSNKVTTVGTQVENASSTLSNKVTTVGTQVENASSTIMNKANLISTQIENASSTIMNKLATVEGKIDTLGTNINTIISTLNTVNTNLSSTLDVVNSIRTAQRAQYSITLFDVSEVQSGNIYRVKLSVLDNESDPIDASSTPTIAIYDSTRALVGGATTTMNKISTGVYEYSTTTSSTATTGIWESIVTTNIGGSDIARNDYWYVTGSPAQVIINSMSDLTTPTISANTTITNEGSGAFEYHYEWCVVSAQDNQCGGSDDVYYASASKLIQTGASFTKDLTATVSNTGTYWFKVVVYYGIEASGASRSFTAVQESAATAVTRVLDNGIPGSVTTTAVTPITTDSVYNQVAQLKNIMEYNSLQLDRVLKTLGIADPASLGFKPLLAINSENTKDLKSIQNKLADLQAVSAVTRRVIEERGTEPVIESYMKFNSVEIHFLITNPLNSRQTVKFKSFLPEEAKPEHIIDASGLKVDYDSNAKTYFVSGDITMGPKETLTKKVEMKDIWLFPEEELISLRKQAGELADILSGTQYDAQGTILKNEIESVITTILRLQKDSYSSPQDHIVIYRDNKARMVKVENNLDKLKDLVVQAGASKGMVGSIGGIQTFATWGIILAIVFGFGLLAAVIFAMWRHQITLAAAAMGMSRQDIQTHFGGARRQRPKRSEKKPIAANIQQNFWESFIRRLPWKKILIWFAIIGLVVVLGILAIKFAPGLFGSRKVEFKNESPAVAPATPQEKSIGSQLVPEAQENVKVFFSNGENQEEASENVKPLSQKLKITDTPTGWLNVRDAASLDGKATGKVYPGEEYEYADEKNGWYKIILKNKTEGWIFGNYIEKIQN